MSYKYFLIYELDLNYVIKVYNDFYIWSVIYQCVKTTFICFKNQNYDVNIIRMLATLAIKVSHTSYSALNKIISLNSIKRFLFAFGFFDAFYLFSYIFSCLCVYFLSIWISLTSNFYKRKNLFESHFMSVIPFVRLSVFFCNTAEIWNANVVLFYFLTAFYKFKHKTLLKCIDCLSECTDYSITLESSYKIL